MRSYHLASVCIAALMFALVGCSSSSETDPADSDPMEMEIKKGASRADVQSVKAASCLVGNGDHTVKTYAKASFSIKSAVAKIPTDVCAHRSIETNRVKAVAEYKSFAKEVLPDAMVHMGDPCENLPAAQKHVADLINDPTNVAVISSRQGDNEEFEDCGYDEFFVYRANGTFIQFTFNYLD